MDSSYSSGTFKANVIPIDKGANLSRLANHSTGLNSLAAFLNHINNFGVLVQNNFEVQFDGLEGITFFVQSFDLPGSKQNTCEIFYDGIKLTIPVNYECEHEFSMTVMNDAQGFIYSAIKSYIEFDTFNHYASSKKKMVIRALTGQIQSGMAFNFTEHINDRDRILHALPLRGDNSTEIAYQGSVIVAYGVRFTSVSGLTYGQSNNDILTFTVSGTLIEYSHLPLSMSDKSISHNI